MEILLNSLYFICMFYFWINFIGYYRLDSEEWQLIKRLREIDDLEPATWREEE